MTKYDKQLIKKEEKVVTKKLKPLTDKQKAAIDIYFTNGFNMTQALVSAGFSQSTAKRQCSTFKKNPLVQAYMEEKRQLIASEKIAKQEEVMQTLTTIVRREQKDQMVLQDGTIVNYKISTADQLKALQLLMKYYGMDKVETNNQINIQTIVYGEDPDNQEQDSNTVEADYIEV